MRTPPRRPLAAAALLMASVAGSRALRAQVPAYLGPLAVPPAGVGTCLPIEEPSGAAAPRVRGRRLAMVSPTPGAARREIVIFVDTTGRVVGYAEDVSTFAGADGGTGDLLLAALAPDGQWRGTRRQHVTRLVNGGRGPDGRPVLPPPVAVRRTPRRALSAGERARVRELAAWTARRCPG